MIYIVVQKGVYRHNIVGVYDDIDKATIGARLSCLAEKDDYHEFEVCVCSVVNTSIEDVAVVKVVSRCDHEYARDVEGLTKKVEHNPPKITIADVGGTNDPT